jgi:hypothetical protein
MTLNVNIVPWIAGRLDQYISVQPASEPSRLGISG